MVRREALGQNTKTVPREAWWQSPVVSALQRLRQKDFNVNLVYTTRPLKKIIFSFIMHNFTNFKLHIKTNKQNPKP